MIIKKEIIDKFIFNTIRKNSMNTIEKPTRLRFNKVTDQNIWRTKPLFTASGYRYAEIEKVGETYNWKVAAYPEDTVLVNGSNTDFHALKVLLKSELKKQGCMFLDEVRLKTTNDQSTM